MWWYYRWGPPLVGSSYQTQLSPSILFIPESMGVTWGTARPMKIVRLTAAPRRLHTGKHRWDNGTRTHPWKTPGAGQLANFDRWQWRNPTRDILLGGLACMALWWTTLAKPIYIRLTYSLSGVLAQVREQSKAAPTPPPPHTQPHTIGLYQGIGGHRSIPAVRRGSRFRDTPPGSATGLGVFYYYWSFHNLLLLFATSVKYISRLFCLYFLWTSLE